PLELVQPPVDDHKHLLANVLHRFVRNAQSAYRSRDERAILVIERLESHGEWRRYISRKRQRRHWRQSRLRWARRGRREEHQPLVSADAVKWRTWVVDLCFKSRAH